MADRGHGGHVWRKLRELVLSEPFLVCGICHAPIDRRRRFPDPRSPSVDLIRSYARGGNPHDVRNLRAAHLGCNSSRGAGDAPRRHWTSTDTP